MKSTASRKWSLTPLTMHTLSPACQIQYQLLVNSTYKIPRLNMTSNSAFLLDLIDKPSTTGIGSRTTNRSVRMFKTPTATHMPTRLPHLPLIEGSQLKATGEHMKIVAKMTAIAKALQIIRIQTAVFRNHRCGNSWTYRRHIELFAAPSAAAHSNWRAMIALRYVLTSSKERSS